MADYLLFTDGSAQPQTREGYGAALLLGPDDRARPLGALSAEIQIFKFTATSSTRVELETLLRALQCVPAGCRSLNVYTDSQNILSLPERRTRLEAQDFRSQKGKALKNASLYRSFFEALDRIGFTLVKVKGHQPSSKRNGIDQRFNLVDRAARRACRTGSFGS
ncbi:MAG: ribonuclease HI [Opitutales bacterium]